MINNKHITLYIETTCNSENTRIAYTKDLTSMMNFINKEVEDIETVDIINWKNSMANNSNTTIARRLGTAKRFFTFLYDTECIPTNPAKTIKPPRISVKEETTLTKEDVQALLSACKNARDKAIISLMASTGIRIAELCNIKVDDIDANNNIKILGKGNKWRMIHLSDKVVDNIMAYKKVRKEGNEGCDNLFISNWGNPMSEHTINHTLKTLAKRANLNCNVHPHMFRHYACTAWVENGVPIQQAQVCLGHSNINTTMRYFETRNKQQVIENVMNMELF